MATKVASLFAEIGANTVPFEQGSKKVKGGLEGLKSGFSSVGLSSVASFLSISGAVAGVAAGIKNASDETLKYAREVRDLAAVSGTGAEASSRLLQVLDDYELTAQDVTAATRFMTKQGLTPTIETLAQLSDQYNAINDPMQQNEFILKNLGRGGLQWVNVLKQGGDALRDQSKAVNENLILTDQQIKETERYRLAIDNMKDTIQGWKVAMVTGFLDAADAQEHAIDTLMAYRDASDLSGMSDQQRGRRLAEVSDEYQRAQAYGEAWGKVLEDNTADTFDADAALKDFNTSMDALNSLIGGELGPAQDDYNQKIAEYQEQLGKARTAEEKMGIQEQIDAETEAYNQRANAIIFNIQQQAILNEVQNHPELAEKAAQVTTDLAYAYGLVDEQTKAVADSTNAAIARFAETGNLEAFEQELKNTAQYAQEASPTIKNMGDIAFHTGERAADASSGLAEMKEAQSELAQGLNKEANPAAAELKKNITSLPPSGTQWNYTFDITVNGRVPRFGMMGGDMIENPNQVSVTNGQFVVQKWSGGQLGRGWTVVGDAPGGAFTPFTEAIDPSGRVYSAKETRKLKEMGVLDGAMGMFMGGTEGDFHIGTGGGGGGSAGGGGGHPNTTGSTRKSGSSGGVSVAGATVTAESIAGGVAADVSANVAGAIGQSAAATVVATTQSNKTLEQIHSTLTQILNKLPGANETLSNDIFVSSLNS